MRKLSIYDKNNFNFTVSIASAIRDFKVWQLSKSHSTSTVEHYKVTFSKLLIFCAKNNLETVQDLSRAMIRQWQVELLTEVTPKFNRPLSPRTIKGIMVDLKAFLNWCVEEEYLDRNPIKAGDMPVVPSILPTHINKEEWEALIQLTSGKDSISRRNQAIIRIMLDTGMRLNEISNLELNDVDLNTGYVIVRKGKGQKQRKVMLGSKSLLALKKYLVMAELSPGDRLWTGTQGFLTYQGFNQVVKNLLKKAGINGKGACHLFRRTCAIQYLRNGESTLMVQNILGHSDGQAMKHYISFLDSDTSTSVRRSSPSDKWN